MTNSVAVCLISALLFCCSDISSARQLPKECTKGPGYWCQSLKAASECGAVGHCSATVWETQEEDIHKNPVSDNFLRVLRELKDVKDLINEDYLATRISAACRNAHYPEVSKICKENTAHFEKYILHVLASNASADTMCRILGMCNNMKIDNLLALNKKKPVDDKHKEPLVGASRCTWGPSYWCSNFSTGRECKATHHCVQRVWSHMTFPVDNDGICKICTDMVTQARDQLQSNETQEELKEVFEGSCDLIPIKLVRSECTKLADDFVPELVETLASQMNPQAVCSVAGLCNNDRIDQLLLDYNKELKRHEGCTNCHKTVRVMRNKYDATSYEDFLTGLLKMCRKTGSLSDSCSMLVFKYYENIVEMLKKDLTPDGVCHLSGQCSYKYHSHDLYTFPEDNLKDVQDDVPCEFCEQLVKHLRDVITANTTKIEFFKIAHGLCNQTGTFRSECNSLVEQYGDVIYEYLLDPLQPQALCTDIGMCGKTEEEPIAPLLPRELAIKPVTTKLIGTDEANSYKPKKQENIRIMGSEVSEVPPPLPVERMFVSLPQSKAGCTFCQYFLHYLQVELSDDRTETRITEAVSEACDRLPQAVQAECQTFVQQYGRLVIAMLVQQIDPATVCPALMVCENTQEVRRVEINSEKSNCPLCLFAVEQLVTILKNNRTEASIRHALDGLCSHLSTKLRSECVDFVDEYSQQLVDMLAADLSAQEVCVYLKLCTATKTTDPLKLTSPVDKFFEKPALRADRNNHRKPLLPKHMLEKEAGGDIETNEIPDNTVNGRPVKVEGQKTVCLVCEFVLKEIHDQIEDKHNEDEIKKVVHGVCKRMPKSVKADCDEFVERYADLVIKLLAQDLQPDQVCQELKLCKPTATDIIDHAKEAILDCAVCETVALAVRKVLANDKVDRNIVHIVQKSCGLLPPKYYDRCYTMMQIYGDSVIHLVEQYGAKHVCQQIGMCSAEPAAEVRLYRHDRRY